jgi:hypothetical protein
VSSLLNDKHVLTVIIVQDLPFCLNIVYEDDCILYLIIIPFGPFLVYLAAHVFIDTYMVKLSSWVTATCPTTPIAQ